jgi:hypothetical protein
MRKKLKNMYNSHILSILVNIKVSILIQKITLCWKNCHILEYFYIRNQIQMNLKIELDGH